MTHRIDSLQRELYEMDNDIASTIRRNTNNTLRGHTYSITNPDIILHKKRLRETIFLNLIIEQYYDV